MTKPTKTLAELAAEQGIGPVADPSELAAPPEHILTDEEFAAWQDAIHGRRDDIGSTWDAPESSPYARLKAYADGNGGTPSPADVRELLGAFNATHAMNGVYVRGNENYRRRFAAVKALLTGISIDPGELHRALTVGTREERGRAHEGV